MGRVGDVSEIYCVSGVVWVGEDVCTWQSNNPGMRVESPRSLIFSFPVNFFLISDQGPASMMNLSCTITAPCEINYEELSIKRRSARITAVVMLIEIRFYLPMTLLLRYEIFHLRLN
jgi:hypothetical protein